ncbi:hypothetical protein [Streptomyces sioyaensis]|uniref:hypothetical protein n=1 Tax=Streptomyces sioyaensis TaxID=67364 RepID=UPI0037A9D7B0
MIRDYLLVMHGLPHTALRLYELLRSMIAETKKRQPGAGLRRMSIDQLCWLLPGVKDKPVSVSTMYELLGILERLDLVVPNGEVREIEGASQLKGKEKAAKGILRGFTVKDLPPAAYTGWRNAWDKLDAYRPDWRENPPQPPTHLTTFGSASSDGRRVDQVHLSAAPQGSFQKTGTPSTGSDLGADPFQKTGTPFQETGTAGQKTGTDRALTSQNRAPKEASPRRSTKKGDVGGDGPKAPSGSSAREAEGGCAASGKDSPTPSKEQPKHSRQELELVAAVRRYFPQEFTVPDIPAVSDAVLKALATGEPDSRTVEQLGSRIETRWHTHGWAMKVLEGEEIKSPVGVAINLVRAYGRDDKWGCPNPRCEAGADVDTGAECNVCPERLEARKAVRRVAEPAQQQPAPVAEPREQPEQPAQDASSDPDYYPDDVRGDGEGAPPAWSVLDEEPVVPAQGGGLDEFAAARVQMRDGKTDRIRRTNQYAR